VFRKVLDELCDTGCVRSFEQFWSFSGLATSNASSRSTAAGFGSSRSPAKAPHLRSPYRFTFERQVEAA
jgi:hypothetical protein